jgi:hypothetical protein
MAPDRTPDPSNWYKDKKIILTKFHDTWVKSVTTGVLTKVIHIWAVWPSFLSRWPIFELDLEIIKTNFQTSFQDIWIKTVAIRVLKRYFYF